jgi:hypothetical protein
LFTKVPGETETAGVVAGGDQMPVDGPDDRMCRHALRF